MSNLNKVILIGRLTADPELRYTQDGKAVANFNLAINRPKKKSSEEKDIADFPKCVAWESNAENIVKYTAKGHLLLVEGRFQTRSWTTPDGEKRYSAEVLVSNFQLMPKNGNGNGSQAQEPQGQQQLPEGDDPAF